MLKTAQAKRRQNAVGTVFTVFTVFIVCIVFIVFIKSDYGMKGHLTVVFLRREWG